MGCRMAGLLLLLGVSCALAATPSSRHDHKLHLQQAKVLALTLQAAGLSLYPLSFVPQLLSTSQADPKSTFSTWVDDFKRAYRDNVEVLQFHIRCLFSTSPRHCHLRDLDETLDLSCASSARVCLGRLAMQLHTEFNVICRSTSADSRSG